MMNPAHCTYHDCRCPSDRCDRIEFQQAQTSYAYGRRYDHPDQTTQYILDTMRSILDELRALRVALSDWRP